MQKITNAVRLLFMILTLIVLFYTYAGLGERVALFMDETGNAENFVPRSTYFYLGLVLIVLTNSIQIFIKSYLKSARNIADKMKEGLIIWGNGLTIFLDIFLISVLLFLYAFNSYENINLDIFGVSVFVCLGIVILWLVSIILFLNRKTSQVA